MIDRSHELPVSRQVKLLAIGLGMTYYRLAPVPLRDLALMRRIDELHLKMPTAGSRMLRDLLRLDGHVVGRRHIATLIKRMGIEAIYCGSRTSAPHPGHRVFAYLLREVSIERPNQVWAFDTTYIPMAQGFVYLTAVIDAASRAVLAHRVATTLEAYHAREVFEDALACYGAPEIVNTDQGSQFTAGTFVTAALESGCQLSMDGRGAWRDDVFVERFWRTIKYEEVYLKAYDSVGQAREQIVAFFIA